jgi:uncharacterized membrane protein YfcA
LGARWDRRCEDEAGNGGCGDVARHTTGFTPCGASPSFHGSCSACGSRRQRENRLIEHVVTFAGFVALGCALGFVGGLFGIGGGIITIPLLGIFFGYGQQLAQGTVLLLVIPTATTGLVQYMRRVKLDGRIIAALFVTAFPLTIVTARIATQLPSATLRYAFVVFLILLAAFIARRAWMLGKREVRKQLPLPYASVLGIVCGIVSGLFTVGGSIFSVPMLTEFFEQPQIAAQAMSLAFSLPGVFLSLAVYGFAGDVNWSVGIPLAIGGMTTASFGVAVAHRLPERHLRFLFVGFIVICATALFVRARELS